MKKKLLVVSILLLTLMSFTGCELLEMLLSEASQRIAIKNCQFKIIDVFNVSYNPLRSLTDISFDMKIGVKNPNDSIDAVMDKIKFNLYVNEKDVLSTTTTQKITINAGSETSFTIPVTLNAINVGQTIVEAIEEEKADYKIIGTSYINTSYGELSFPITVTEGSWSTADSQSVEL